MKTNTFASWRLTLLLCLPLLAACGDDDTNDNGIVWDFAPIDFTIAVQDAEGNDLLNPITEGNILNQDIKAIYKGIEYKLNEPVAQTKVYLAVMQGLQTFITEDGSYLLSFGELDGTGTYDNETLTLDWGDGSSDVITFSSRLTWHSPEEPEINRHFSLNGTEQEHSFFRLTKQAKSTPSMRTSSWDVISNHYAAEADNEEEIIGYLQTNSTLQTGCGYNFSLSSTIITEGDHGIMNWTDTEGNTIAEGSVIVRRIVNMHYFDETIWEKYQLYPPDNQIYFYMQWEASFNEETHVYDVLAVRAISGFYCRLWLYEDLTEACRTAFPEQTITKVVQVLVSQSATITTNNI